MTLYDLTKKYGEGKGEGTMWKTLALVSDAIENSMEPSAKHKLMRSVYGAISNGHYNDAFAKEDIAKMYYVDDAGRQHNAPYWTDEQMGEVYEKVKASLPSAYNACDFAVTMNMIKSDNCALLHKWFPNATQEEMDAKLVDLAVNWLNDSDNPLGDAKIWRYLNK